ncbi:MAG: FAD-dependent oxidoreductase [Spirochaetales bacterium]|nr:FAD-dependent oxidoreductase [Spirochaetales bacterium]
MNYLIVGGVAGGATTAARLRRIDESALIIIVERGEHISYANCGLPYYIGEVIPERERLFVQTPESFKAQLNIDVLIRTEAISVDRGKKTLRVKNLQTSEEKDLSYDVLVLSPGAEPVRPPIPGINSPGIFTLRSVPETDAIKSFVDEQKPKKAVIVGAGFIGLEMAENLHHRGIFVTIVEMAQQVMNVVDYEMAAQVHQHLKSKNVEFYLKDGVAAFQANQGSGPKILITLKSGRAIDADMVILSIGVRPESKLAKEAGLEVGATGGIVVNEFLQTTDPAIYAVGDAIEYPNPITGIPGITYLAGPANKQGRLCADNIVYGNKRSYRGSIATAVAKVFDLTVATTGASEKTLRAAGMKFESIITHSSSHAGYYPDAMPLTLKTLFNKENGKVYGAQIVGYDGVDKRIDLIASVVKNNGTIFDLIELEHAYAPPYSSAKDPVNIAGYVADNIIHGDSRHIHWHEVQGCDQSEILLLDVRTPEEYALGSIEGALNIPTYELRNRLDEIDKNKSIVVFCGVGLRAYQAERVLRQSGFEDVFNLSGGYKTYEFAVQKQGNEDIFSKDIIWKDDSIYQATPREFGSDGKPLPSPGVADKPVSPLSFEAIKVDAVGLQCPGPILKLKKVMDEAKEGQQIIETASDPGFAKDAAAWCRMTGNTLVSMAQEGGKYVAVIEKARQTPISSRSVLGSTSDERSKGTTLVVFSDSLDKALASLVIANGAAGAGKQVTMFFTFWGLSLLKKEHKPQVRKDFMGTMFGMMLPGSSKAMGLSKMNFGGTGAGMMRNRMKKKNIASLEEMLQSALEGGVRMVACQMSMDMMGIDSTELIDGVEIGGVATYLEQADHAGLNLFV